MTSFVIWLITMVLILETKILDSAFNHFTEIRKITFFLPENVIYYIVRLSIVIIDQMISCSMVF